MPPITMGPNLIPPMFNPFNMAAMNVKEEFVININYGIVSSHDEQFISIQQHATNVTHATVPTEPSHEYEYDFKLYCLNHLLNILL